MFETDPCGTSYTEVENEIEYSRGNCTAPNTCTCWCRASGTEPSRDFWERDGLSQEDESGKPDPPPWNDELGLAYMPSGTVEGSYACTSGFEGIPTPDGKGFLTCHFTIKEPTWMEYYSVTLVVVGSIFCFCSCVAYFFVRRRLRMLAHKKKIERRRSRKSSLTDMNSSGAFRNS